MTIILVILSALCGGGFGCVLGTTYPDPQGRKAVTIGLTIGVGAMFAAITLGARS